MHQLVTDAQVLTTQRGETYTPRRVYEYDGHLWTKIGHSYLKLYSNGKTSSPRINWVGLETPGHLQTIDKLGRMKLK
jgi:hypothetical protein